MVSDLAGAGAAGVRKEGTSVNHVGTNVNHGLEGLEEEVHRLTPELLGPPHPPHPPAAGTQDVCCSRIGAVHSLDFCLVHPSASIILLQKYSLHPKLQFVLAL